MFRKESNTKMTLVKNENKEYIEFVSNINDEIKKLNNYHDEHSDLLKFRYYELLSKFINRSPYTTEIICSDVDG